MANIGVKYCGQCNSFLRLREVYDELCKLDPGNSYDHFYEPDKPYDALIVLCGCDAQCAKVSGDYPIFYFSPFPSDTPKEVAGRIYKEIKAKNPAVKIK